MHKLTNRILTPRVVQSVLSLAVLLLVGTGCDTNSTQGFSIEPGLIIDFGRPVKMTINGTVVASRDEGIRDVVPIVRAGVPFDVTTSPMGGSCDYPSRSIVTMSGRVATVAVRDSIAYETCDYYLREHPRTDRITFAEPGEATVVIRGGAYNEQGTPRPLPEVDLRFPIVVTR